MIVLSAVTLYILRLTTLIFIPRRTFRPRILDVKVPGKLLFEKYNRLGEILLEVLVSREPALEVCINSSSALYWSLPLD